MASENKMTRILITGIAGFIGYNLAMRLLNEGKVIYGIEYKEI